MGRQERRKGNSLCKLIGTIIITILSKRDIYPAVKSAGCFGKLTNHQYTYAHTLIHWLHPLNKCTLPLAMYQAHSCCCVYQQCTSMSCIQMQFASPKICISSLDLSSRAIVTSRYTYYIVMLKNLKIKLLYNTILKSINTLWKLEQQKIILQKKKFLMKN